MSEKDKVEALFSLDKLPICYQCGVTTVSHENQVTCVYDSTTWLLPTDPEAQRVFIRERRWHYFLFTEEKKIAFYFIPKKKCLATLDYFCGSFVAESRWSFVEVPLKSEPILDLPFFEIAEVHAGLQRYITVLQVIRDINERRKITDVTEFGCGSFVFFDNYLSRCDFIHHVNQIDINRERLAGALHMIKANECNKLSNTKREPLKIDIFEGNVAKKDSRTQNTDVVVAIEVIEHLFEQDLRLFPATVFGFINPKVVIVTTPNHDFNALFDNGNKFRDEDHKFEFTKAQFKQWAGEITDKYPEYDVKFFGIGEIPSGCSKQIGFCTQMAIFERKETPNTCRTSINVQEYVSMGSYAYFTEVDDIPEEEKLWQRINNLVINYIVDEEDLLYVDNEKCQWGNKFVCLPLNLLLKNYQVRDISEDDLIAIITKFGNIYSIKYFENYGNLLIVTDECEQYCGDHCKES